MDRGTIESVTANPRNRSGKPVSITDAQPSRAAELHRREVRYVLMMTFRAVCLVVATILVYNHVPLLGLWIPFLLFAMLVVPWLAVILANDRPPKSQYRLAGKLHHGHRDSAADQRALTADDPGKTIDSDPDD